ncbi:MAG: MFS transporter [Candidatus Delongbacteria bacterium]|nr:MFS transporter [Candidatus Delongbacteria bacterium]
MNKIKRYINKESLSWALYDWANSAFATTVMAVFFPLFFNDYWSKGIDTVDTTARLGFANSAVGILIMLSAPILGFISDNSSLKKRFLLIMTLLGSLSTILLFFVGQGTWFIALLLYVIATIGFSGGNIFYDALLTSVATKKRYNFVSSLGYSLGYLGGGILLAFNIFMSLNPEMFGIENSSDAIRYAFVSVGVWWLLFSIPLFSIVKEKKNKRNRVLDSFRQSFKGVYSTFKEIKDYKPILYFLIAYWLYIDGVDTIVRMAMDFGISLNLNRDSLIKAFLLTQFIGFPAALIFGILAKGKKGARNGIYFTLIIYLGVSIFGALLETETQFFVLAGVIGLVQGGIQALSRSYFAEIIPKERAGEFFGFYNMIGKFAVVLGPLLIGTTGLMLRKFGMDSEMATRGGIFSVSLFFIAGGIMYHHAVRVEKRDGQINNI